ncbi:hypothetical protein PRIC1_004238 [Phytophthora ramorum]|uniref:RxLR effector protein n=1 Tax=Phytophthora ramorum TaxID=164328 RepID=UPI0030B31950|nr:RxLR effector protein [Phytophthora ramorum]KAH7484916.1 RxLR effector protein [Phytophthora ramorum]
MRLSYILLVATAALVATLDATSAASGTTLVQPRTANAVDPATAHETIGNDRRFLRKHKVVEDADVDGTEDVEDEERGFAEMKALGWFAIHYPGVTNVNGVMEAMRGIQDSSRFITLFDKAEVLLKKVLPDFRKGMAADDFNAMIFNAAHLTDDQQGVLISAYSKYLHALEL